MKKYLPWAGIVALLIGLALLPGPKAGASPVPATLTYTVAQNPAGTQEIVTWTVTNTSDGPSGFFDYGCYYHVTQCAPDFGNGMNQLALAAGASSTFHYTYPCGTPGGDIDIADPYNDYDLAVHWTWDGTCTPPTTTTTVPPTTTTVPAPPVVTPPAPPAAIPPAAPQATLTPPAAVQAPLAFTGSPVLPETAVALTLIALGTAALALRRKLAA